LKNSLIQDRSPEDRIVLTYTEINSPLWVKIFQHLDAKLQRIRVQNDNIEADSIATAVLRGRIAVIKELKNLADLDKQAPIRVSIPGGDERIEPPSADRI